jgi:hypothetical protein
MDDILRIKLREILTTGELKNCMDSGLSSGLTRVDKDKFLFKSIWELTIIDLDYLCRTLFVPGECIADNVTIAVDLLLSRAEVHLNDLALIKNEGAG